MTASYHHHSGGRSRLPRMDYARLKEAARACNRTLVPSLLPGGRWEGRDYVVRNPLRQDRRPGSFRISDNGSWRDHATGDWGSDYISLVAYLRSLSQGDAAKELASWLSYENQMRAGNVSIPSIVSTARGSRHFPASTVCLQLSTVDGGDTRAFARTLWKEAREIPNTPAETYLKGRGIRLDPWPADIRFHPALKHTPSGRKWPAMTCAIRCCGAETHHLRFISLHRTYLAPDGNGKADVECAKMALGKMAGGAVMLAMPTDGRLLIAEGIENALTAMQATGIPAWAGVSAGNLPNLILPPVEEARTSPSYATMTTPGYGMRTLPRLRGAMPDVPSGWPFPPKEKTSMTS